MSTQAGVIILIVGLIAAAVLATVVSRWALKMDRRAKRRRQRDIQRRHRIGGVMSNSVGARLDSPNGVAATTAAQDPYNSDQATSGRAPTAR
jgi:hypothetical protein